MALIGLVVINLFLDSYKVKVLNLCATSYNFRFMRI